MMMMSPGVRKLMLTVHVMSSVGWLGAIAAYIAVNVPVVTGGDEQAVRAAHLMMNVIMKYALIPLALASWLTGIVQALLTPWGLFRHYWVTISLGLTTLAAVILVVHAPAVQHSATVAADPRADVTDLGGDLPHAIAGLLVLIIPMVLNMYKPRGLTRYGWRKRAAGLNP